MKFNTIEELLHYTEAIKGKTFKEIDSKHLLENTTNLKRNKGILGHVVESGFYKYPINSNPQADFDKIGVELKVTGYKKNKKGGYRSQHSFIYYGNGLIAEAGIRTRYPVIYSEYYGSDIIKWERDEVDQDTIQVIRVK